nr:rhomboid family intramembrane serine protease [Schaalia sp. ZJ1691]
MSMPTYGRRSNPSAAPECPRHPGVRSVDYCKKCNRPMCSDCLVHTEVRNICVDCAGIVRRSARVRGPVVTYTIIGICAVLFLLGAVPSFVGVDAVEAWIRSWLAFTPVYGLIQPWRFFSTAFLHSGILHVAFNMLALYWVGQALESALGHWRFANLYALSAIGGSVFVLAWSLADPMMLHTVTVGASGAVFGLFGGVLVMQRTMGQDTRSILVLLGINLAYGFIGSNISWQAHLGGLITGLLVTWIYMRVDRPRPSVTARRQSRQAVAVSAGMWVVMVVLTGLIYRLIFESGLLSWGP